MTFDQAADRILDCILAHDGVFEVGEPGEVLGNLAAGSDVPYKMVSLTVIRLEGMGWIQVTRLDTPEPRRANRIVRLEIL